MPSPTPHPPGSPGSVDPPGRFRMLALLSAVELLGMALWFTGSAIAPVLAREWDLSATESAWLTSVVQAGFVLGTATAALLNLADIVPARFYLAACATLAALCNGGLIWAPSFELAVLCRLGTGFFLAGVYPPAMKMIATWFRAGRGLAIGTLVGALTLGQATPYVVSAFSTWQQVVSVASAGALLGAVLVFSGYREGPFAFARRPFSWSLVGVVLRHRETRLATAGYLGHMWELYGMWTWLPTFFGASVLAWSARTGEAVSPAVVSTLSFLAIAMGSLGCIWGGWAADRRGRAWLVRVAMAWSGVCALLVGTVYGLSPWIAWPLLAVWGFFIVADSAQFSALVTEVAPPHAVGTALTLQTSLGFLLTVVTVQGVPWLAEMIGWRWAFAVLAAGPAAGILAIGRLRR